MAGGLDEHDPPAPVGTRAAVLADLADRIAGVRPGRRAVVAIDGVDGAGKTVLGRELAMLLDGVREVHRASLDGFHRPRAERYARGRTPETFYGDSYDHEALRHRLLAPFRAGRPWARAAHDVETDRPVEAVAAAVGPDALLLLDGIFLQRAELALAWDAVVWVDVPFEVSVPRGNARFGPVGARESDPASPANARYVGGQRLYLAEVGPGERATWVLDNTDLTAPVLRGTAPAPAARPTASG